MVSACSKIAPPEPPPADTPAPGAPVALSAPSGANERYAAGTHDRRAHAGGSTGVVKSTSEKSAPAKSAPARSSAAASPCVNTPSTPPPSYGSSKTSVQPARATASDNNKRTTTKGYSEEL